MKLFDGYEQLCSNDFEHPVNGTKHDDVVYAVEFGKYVKVGCTSDLKRRMRQLLLIAENYAMTELGRIAVTDFIHRGRRTEAVAHDALSDFRVGKSEMFDCSFSKVVSVLESIEVHQ